MDKVLVVGGTGMLGRPVAVRLLSDGFAVRIFTGHPDRARRFFGDLVEYAAGDAGNRESLIRAMDGCDYVYVNLKGGPTKGDFLRVERDGSKNIYSAAKESGIKKVVQISEARADERHIHFIQHRAKVEAEKALAASGLTYIVLKPTWFCESIPLFIRGGKATLIGSGKVSFHFLAAADYAKMVSECFQSSKADNKSLVVFGPERVSLTDAMQIFLSIVHPGIKISRLPMWLARLSAAFSMNAKLRAVVNLMAFFDKNDDTTVAGDPSEADAIFGRSTTTVEEYARMYRQIVKG